MVGDFPVGDHPGLTAGFRARRVGRIVPGSSSEVLHAPAFNGLELPLTSSFTTGALRSPEVVTRVQR